MRVHSQIGVSASAAPRVVTERGAANCIGNTCDNDYDRLTPPPIMREVLRSPGQPLNVSTEPKIGDGLAFIPMIELPERPIC
jgi:hypothetical protein